MLLTMTDPRSEKSLKEWGNTLADHQSSKKKLDDFY